MPVGMSSWDGKKFNEPKARELKGSPMNMLKLPRMKTEVMSQWVKKKWEESWGGC